MSFIKTSATRMPGAGVDGIVTGGKYWVSEDFDVETPANWDGIVLDSTGLLVGNYKGISVWNTGDIKILISESGIAIYGGASVWVPDGYDPLDQDTWDGVVINSTAIKCYEDGNEQIIIQNSGIVAKTTASGSIPIMIETSDFLVSGKLGTAAGFFCGATTGLTYAEINVLGYPGGGAAVGPALLALQGSGGNICVGGSTSSERIRVVCNNTIALHLDGSGDANTSVTAIKFTTNGEDWEVGARGSSAATNPNNFYIYNNTDAAFRFLISAAGDVVIPALAGSGNRAVMADENGKLYC